MKCPCSKNCTERKYACHDTCEKYIAFTEWSKKSYERRRMLRETNSAKISLVEAQMKKADKSRANHLNGTDKNLKGEKRNGENATK